MNTHTMENVEDIYPLSPIQQGMLFHSLHGSEADVYFQQFVFTFDAPLTADAFRRAWQDTLERHTILRTAFLWEGLDEPLQLVFHQVTLPFVQHDWRQLTADEQQAQLEAYLEADRQRGFDLSAPPLLRVTMIRLAAAHYHVIWSHHHILLDGWSVPLIIQEVFGRYEALLAGRAFLPTPAHPFREYIAWLQERDLGQAEAFWRQALQGLDAPTPLGIGHTVRAYAPIEHYDQRDLRLPAATTEQLRAFARRERLTLNTLVQGAWALLLSRYSGQEDVLFGVTVSGRALPLPAIETMIGIFINTLPLRIRSAPDARLVPWLQAIQAQQLERYAYSPLVQIQAWSEIAPPTPLFESIVVFENFPADQLYDQQRRSAINNFHAIERTNYPLALGAEPGSELVLSLTYDAQRFAPAAIERLLRHLQALLDEMLADPSGRLADLSLLLADERRLLLYDWNATQTDYPQETSIHALVAAQVARTPDAIAVVFGGQGSGGRGQGAARQGLPREGTRGDKETRPAPSGNEGRQGVRSQESECLVPDPLSPIPNPQSATLRPQSSVLSPQSLTYRELNVRANRLAHHLQTLGVGPEVRVGICLERSPELIIALLGVLNAGGAYVPLDPTYPDARLAFIIDDAQVAVILTRRVLAQPPRPALASPVTLYLDVEWPSIQEQRDIDRRPPPVEGDSPAYMIYTSGSLGRPKGVVVPHRALVNYTLAAAENFAITAADRVLQFASISFDASAEEIYPTLISGATLVLRSDAMLETAAIFLRSCWAWEISVLDLPMSYWHEVVAALAEGSATLSSRVRLVIIGAEKALPERLALWWQHVSTSVQLINTYGPTEATIVATAQELTRPDAGEPAEHEIPIGRPVANVQAYVLDRHMRLAPIGVPGELYLGGTCLARGYLDRPDLTAERFIPNPFAEGMGDKRSAGGGLGWGMEDAIPIPHPPSPGTRLYRTGDLVRYRSDGVLEFLGRIDDQVKLRGFRIELGEIAAVLRMHPDVRDAVVVMREERPGEKRLVAYVVTSDKSRVTSTEDSSLVTRHSLLVTELCGFLQERLPDYMVPSAFVLLEALPLTPGGKLDRRALPAPTQQAEEAIAPRTPTEQLVAGIWATILHLPQVSLNDNFFELGGHSLLAAQLTSRLRGIFQIDLPLRRLFDAPTLQQLAAGIDEARRGEPRPVVPPLVPVARAGAMPLSLAQQRLWFLQQLVPDNPFYNIPVPLRLTGALDLHCLRRSLNEIIRRHEGLRTCFPAVNGQTSQQILPELRLTLPVADLSGLPPDERTVMTRQFASEDAHRLFDLARGPLLRASMLRLSGVEHILLLNVHHIVFDGWSVGVLIQELQALYGAYLAGRPSPLPELAIQYADFAHWQRTWLQGDVLDAQINYWRQQLDGAPALLALPTDHPRPAVHTFRGNSLSATLTAELTHALHQLSQQEGVTLFMALLAAFQVLLFRYTGQTDILVGSGTANRNRPEVEPLIGFFVSTLVMRTDLSGNPDFRALLNRVREVALDAYAHQDVPFDKVVEELQPERALSYSPIFQVALVYQNFPTLSLSLPGLELDVVQIEHASAKFDMTLFVTDSADGLFLTLECNADLFERPTIRRMLDHFQIVLAGVSADPYQPIANLPLLTAAERDALATWNQTRRPELRTGCIHELFSAQAAHAPDAVAIVFDQPPTTIETRGQGLPRVGTRGDKEIRSQESGVRSQDFWRPIPNPQSPIPNPRPSVLSPQSSVLNS